MPFMIMRIEGENKKEFLEMFLDELTEVMLVFDANERILRSGCSGYTVCSSTCFNKSLVLSPF